ncbi:MAG: SLBB domain-containing protein, partial [Burkholderiales bacterium]
RSRQVSVLGEVARPGRYPLDGARVRLTDVLALAGGITPQGADTVTVVAARRGETNRIEVNVPAMYRAGDFVHDIELQSGDSIYVPRAPVFYIYGEVQRAGVYRLEPGMTVVQALSVGGGLTPRGTERGLEIRRRTPDGKTLPVETRLTARVEPDDVIYVKESLF